MGSLAQSGRFELGPVHAAMVSEFGAVRAGEADIADATRRVLADAGYVVCPHTACAFGSPAKAGRSSKDGAAASANGVPEVVLATASPAKFPEALEATTGLRPGLPRRLSHLMTDPEHFDVLPNDLAAVERYVEAHAMASQPATKAGAA